MYTNTILSFSLFPTELDYFDEAVNYLYKQDYVKTSAGIGVIGISKAAEIALLMGTYFEDTVCAINL